jgi:hypothetical protein
MQRINEHRVRPRLGRTLGRAAAVLLFATALCKSDLAYAAPHGGGGGFHGGGGFDGGGLHAGAFHGGFGGFHGGGWHGGFGGLHNGLGYGHGSHWYHGWRGGQYGWWGDGLGRTYYPYGWDYYPDYGYYSSGQPSASQNWYYCSDPAGYYPYVTQCNTGWQTVPAS